MTENEGKGLLPASETPDAGRPPRRVRRESEADAAARSLDKFYTRSDVAEHCMGIVRRTVEGPVGTWLEPSAGGGAFLRLMPANRIGLDIAPTGDEDLGIETADFLKWRGTPMAEPVVAVGNPPFGRNSSLAVAFINKAAEFCEYVCMIVPRTLEKEATQRRITKHLHLIGTFPIDPASFELNGGAYSVPCCFQIWRRDMAAAPKVREKRELGHSDFSYLPRDQGEKADFAFQRVGVNAGLVSDDGRFRSWKSNHYILVNDRDPANVARVRALFESIDWTEIKARTAGNPSIGKAEIVEEYSKLSENVDRQGSLF